MRRLLITTTVVSSLLLLGATAAQAEELKPWWHLASSTRPTYLNPAAAKDETLQLTVSATAGKYRLEDGKTKKARTLNVGATFAQVQEALEELYGTETVEVTGSSSEAYEIKFVGALAGRYVEPVVVKEANVTGGAHPAVEVKELVKGRVDGLIVLSATNLGDASANPEGDPVTVSDVLPPGLEAVEIEGIADETQAKSDNHLACSLGSLSCTFKGKEECAGLCTPKKTVAPYQPIEMRIAVDVKQGAHSGEENAASIAGGGAAPASAHAPLTVSEAPVPFGVSTFEMRPEEAGGAIDTQAGSHPFQFTTTIGFNEGGTGAFEGLPFSEEPLASVPIAPQKDLSFALPRGFIGNPDAVAKCTLSQFVTETVGHTNECPADTAIGIARVLVSVPAILGREIAPFSEPLFNLEPAAGEPARFGFAVYGNPVILDAAVRTGSDYGVTVNVNNITQVAGFYGSEVTFWGVPGDPRHDNARGWGCYEEAEEDPLNYPCQPQQEVHAPPFLSLPTSCDGPLTSSVVGDTWAQAAARHAEGLAQLLEPLAQTTVSVPSGMDGCNRLPFGPQIRVTPDNQAASGPSGLNVDVHVPQEVNGTGSGFDSSNVKDITVALPAGVAINPSSGDGLEACSGDPGALGAGALGSPGDEIGYEGVRTPPLESGSAAPAFTPRLPGSFGAKGAVAAHEIPESEATLSPGINFCANASKIASVTIHSPLLPNPLQGFVYLAAQESNPFGSVLAMYLVAEDPVSATLVKLPGRVQLCQGAGEVIFGMTCQGLGQIITSFENNPELAFEDAELHFFGGERAPLANPPRCGSYTTSASFVPWSGGNTVNASSAFHITTGPKTLSEPGGSACPGASLPFSPQLTGGGLNVNAGAFSPFTLTMTRQDGEQNLQSVQAHLPPGLSGLLTNVELCPEPQANQGTCGPNSLIGETTVGVGVGGSPFTVHGGKFYLTGPYNGTSGCTVGTPPAEGPNSGCAPFGITFAVPAKAGPFDFAKTAKNHPACDCVLVRGKIEVDPFTAALTVTSNPPGTPDAIPTSLEGIPLEIQHVNAITTRGNFQFNPTNCNKMEVTGTIHSSENATDTIGVPFQVTNCAALKFAPSISFSTNGKTSKTNGASLVTKVSYPNGPQGTYANLAYVKVELPKHLPSRLTTLQRACTQKQFELNPAACPSESKIGYALVHTPLLPVPLSGPAIFVSHGDEAFPSLEMVLQGYGVTIDLVGATFIKNGVTSTTFKTVPDQPFSTFELTLPQGKFSALAANGNLCALTTAKTVSKKVTVKVKGRNQTVTRKVKETVAESLIMPNEFVAQNGAVLKQNSTIKVTGCAKPKKAKTAKHATHKGKKK
jgi:hypothetical protein